MGRKQCWKRRNCSLRAISFFSHSVFKRLGSQGRQKVSLCGNGLKGVIYWQGAQFGWGGGGINPLPKDKILDWSKLKAFADDKINVTKKLKFVVGWVENIVGKRRKCWLPAFSPFPTMFSKGYFLMVIKSQDCVVKG